MKPLIIFFNLCLFIAGLHAAAPHPTVLTVKYKDELLSVIKVIGSDPVVLVDGKEKRIRTEPIYLPQRTDRFSRESVKIRNISMTGTQIRFVANDSDTGDTEARVGDHGGVAHFTATLTAEQSLSGGFVAVVLYLPSTLETAADLGRTQIVVYQLPPLPAGVDVPISIGSKMFTHLPGQKYFVHLFDATGHEILTDAAKPGWAFYGARERARMADIIARYRERYAGQNLAASPAVIIRPYLPPGFVVPDEPVTVQLEVTMQGEVEAVSVTGISDPKVDRAVREAMGGWLFFPQLKAGDPVRSTVRFPLKF